MASDLSENEIYEIFRACRLCGAGGGYKMPIMPSVVGFDCEGLNLRQKIQDCLHIEVSPDDKMPPLICEICVEKVSDFYEFIEMSRKNMARTRLRLGLPPLMVQGSSDSGDCILGVTEPICVDDDDRDEPPRSMIRVKKDHELKMKEGQKITKNAIKKQDNKKIKKVDKKFNKKEAKATTSAAALNEKKSLQRELDRLMEQMDIPPTTTGVRQFRATTRDVRTASMSSSDSRISAGRETRDNVTLSTIKMRQDQKKSETPKPKSMKREKELMMEESDDDEILTPRSKRHRELAKETPKTDSKKPKITTKLRSPSPPKYKPGPKSRKLPPPPAKVPSSPPAPHKCNICGLGFQAGQGLASHLRAHHTIIYTPPELTCNPCGDWFPTAEETAAHHKRHKTKPYRCRGCKQTFKIIEGYNQHIETTGCVPWSEVPDVKCPQCWRLYPTRALYAAHACGGPDSRPGGKCTNCKKSYLTLKNLKKHESICANKKKGATTISPTSKVKVSPSVRKRLMQVQIRVVKCDVLLKPKRKRYDVSRLPHDFALDKRCVYPYRSLVRIKPEPLHFDGMVSIGKDVRDEFYVEEDYVHWDSDLSSDSDGEYSLVDPSVKIKKVPSLTSLSLKTIFSKRCLGKVPRKLRKMKDKFDSFFNMELETDVNDIINNLGEEANDIGEDSGKDTESQNSENLLCDVNNIINGLGSDNEAINSVSVVNDNDVSDAIKSDSNNDKEVNETDEVNCVSADVNDNDSITDASKNGDNDSVTDASKNDDNDSFNLNSNGDGDFNRDSDSIIDQAKTETNVNNDFDSLKNSEDANINDVVDKNINNDTETDVSDEESNKNVTEKDTTSEISHDVINNGEHVNGNTVKENEDCNGVTEPKSDDIIKDIDALTGSEGDKALINELDAQIDEKDTAKEVSVVEKVESLLKDLMPDKVDNSMDLDNISEGEFDFDA